MLPWRYLHLSNQPLREDHQPLALHILHWILHIAWRLEDQYSLKNLCTMGCLCLGKVIFCVSNTHCCIIAAAATSFLHTLCYLSSCLCAFHTIWSFDPVSMAEYFLLPPPLWYVHWHLWKIEKCFNVFCCLFKQVCNHMKNKTFFPKYNFTNSRFSNCTALVQCTLFCSFFGQYVIISKVLIIIKIRFCRL